MCVTEIITLAYKENAQTLKVLEYAHTKVWVNVSSLESRIDLAIDRIQKQQLILGYL